jgi:hypothetical protein
VLPAQDTDMVSAAMKQKGEEESGEGEREVCTAMRRSLNS